MNFEYNETGKKVTDRVISMSGKSPDESQVNAKNQVLDLWNEILAETSEYEAEDKFSLTELSDKVNLSSSALIDLQNRFEIFKPRKKIKGKEREVWEYSLLDFQRALFAARLKEELKYTPRQIAAVINQIEGISSLTLEGEDYLSRATAMIQGRLLHSLTAILYEGRSIRDSLITVVRTLAIPRTLKRSSMVTGSDPSDLIGPLGDRFADIVVGKGDQKTGEIYVIEARQRARRLLEKNHWKLFALSITDQSRNYVYSIYLGLPVRFTDASSKYVIQMLSQAANEGNFASFNENNQRLVLEILESLFKFSNVYIRDANKNQPKWDSLVSVLMDLIANSLSNPEYYCGLLVPVQYKPEDPLGSLRFMATSGSFPDRLRSEALYRIEETLPGWVYKHKSELIINKVIDYDPRLTFQELEDPSNQLLIPVYNRATDGPSHGVLYVGASHAASNDLKETDIALLRLFSEIANEMLTREILVQGVVKSAWIVAGETDPFLVNKRDDFRDDIKGQLYSIRREQSEDRLTRASNRELRLLAVRILNFDDLEQKGDLADWACVQARRLITQFLRSQQFPQDNIRIYQLDRDRFVVLIPEVNAQLPSIHKEFNKYMEKLHNLSTTLKIEVAGWSLDFLYETLQKMEPLEVDGEKHEPEDIILLRTEGVLHVLPLIRHADQLSQLRDFEGALRLYQRAEKMDPLNPYHPRHQALCYMELGEYENALQAAERALRLDRTYDGTYRRFAQIWLRQGDPTSALKAIEIASFYKKREPRNDLLKAEAIILQRRLNDEGALPPTAIISAIRDAELNDVPGKETQAKYAFYRGQAYEFAGDHPAAEKAYNEALKNDPNDAQVIWALEQLRQKSAVKDLKARLKNISTFPDADKIFSGTKLISNDSKDTQSTISTGSKNRKQKPDRSQSVSQPAKTNSEKT
jgi:tetratricopeptide (TPR) repeat protein